MKTLLCKTLFCIVTLLVSTVSTAEELRIFNWLQYIPDEVIDQFEKEYKVEVIYDTYDSAEKMETQMLTGASGYDLVFPGSSNLGRLIASGALEKIDTASLTNLNNIDPEFMQLLRDTGDTSNEYAVPYLWGTNIIGYNKTQVKEATEKDELNSWNDILNVEAIKKLDKCGVAMMDSPTEIIPLVLFHLDLDPYTTKAADYKKTKEFMSELRPYIRYFNSSQYVEDLANGEICAVIGWSGSLFIAANIAKANNNGNDIRMALPSEGTMVWFDNMAIPKGAPNKAMAEKFINFMLRPEIIAKASNTIGYANPNLKATKLVNNEIKNNPAMYISEDMMKKLFAQKSLTLRTEKIRTRVWTNIKTGR